MCKDASEYQKYLIEAAIDALKTPTPDLEEFVLAISYLEDARDLKLSTTEEERYQIMNKW